METLQTDLSKRFADLGHIAAISFYFFCTQHSCYHAAVWKLILNVDFLESVCRTGSRNFPKLFMFFKRYVE